MEDGRVWFTDMTNPNEDSWCHVYADGRVDFENYDHKYENEVDAIMALEADGWEIVGVDHD